MGSASNDELRAEVSRDRRGPWFLFRKPTGFEWTRVRVPVPGLAAELSGFRFIHLSDLHVRGTWFRAYDELVERVERARVDLLLITGDFVDDKTDHRIGLPSLRRMLPRLKARLGVYGILGNHDGDLLAPYLGELGVKLIDGRRAVLESGGGAKLELVGLPGLARRDLDAQFIASIPPKEAGTLRVVMSHYPDHFRRVRPLRADVFLAGHSHGGQCCLPGGRALLTHDRMPKRLCKGVHRLEESWYVVSRGFGFAGVPVRVNCPPEVAEIEVVSA
ncbi:MAG TPA: metallophosphoesterase [Gemmataceae bacterium]|nr:metallophosphoesterase [Gemmataceae bacterium]